MLQNTIKAVAVSALCIAVITLSACGGGDKYSLADTTNSNLSDPTLPSPICKKKGRKYKKGQPCWLKVSNQNCYTRGYFFSIKKMQASWTGECKNNRLHGTGIEKTRISSGLLGRSTWAEIGTYVEGFRQGQWKSKSPNGGGVLLTGNYVDGKAHGEHEYTHMGFVSCRTYHNGVHAFDRKGGCNETEHERQQRQQRQAKPSTFETALGIVTAVTTAQKIISGQNPSPAITTAGASGSQNTQQAADPYQQADATECIDMDYHSPPLMAQGSFADPQPADPARLTFRNNCSRAIMITWCSDWDACRIKNDIAHFNGVVNFTNPVYGGGKVTFKACYHPYRVRDVVAGSAQYHCK